MMYDEYEYETDFGFMPAVNVGDKERVASVAGGVALLSVAVFKRGPLSIPALFSGLVLLLRGLTGICPAYKALGINTAEDAEQHRRSENISVPAETGIHVVRAVTINRSAEDLYNFWRNPANLPSIMKYVESVEYISPERAHWTIKLPAGAKSEFDAEVYTDVPNEVISWRSLPGSQIPNAGSIRFKPAPVDRGTEVTLTIEFVPPGGALGQAVMKMFNEAPSQYIGQYLRDFKMIMETGEQATTEGQPSGRSSEYGR
jgi:uncharacterized membrane protein